MGQQSVFVTYAGDFRVDSLDVPQNPPFISAMSVIWLDDIQTLNSPLKVKGDVAEQVVTTNRLSAVDWIKDPQPPSVHLVTKVTMKYDAGGHEIERDEEDAAADGWRKIMRSFEGDHLISEVGDSGRKRGPNPQGWLRMAYENGHLAEMKKGHGEGLENHYLNFRYDPQGRVTHYEYRQGKSDQELGTVDLKYSADTVETDEIAPQGKVVTTQIQKLDASGRVIDGELKLWYHASFRYDDKSRVIEQVSDERELGEGDDYVPLPGRVMIQYDDKKLTRTEEFYEKGVVALRAVAQLDRDGEELSLQVFDGSGKEKEYSATVPDAATGKPVPRAGKCAWEVDYDSHSNWTQRRLWFTPTDGSRILLNTIHRTITYR
jgi:hypothetical protein